MGERETPKPVIGMCQGPTLILLVDGRQIVIPCGSMIYAAELAAAINEVTSDVMSGDAVEASPHV